VIEFGWYFVRYETLTRAVSATSESIITLGGNVSQTDANQAGTGLIPFGRGGNYICAQAYQYNTNMVAANPVCTSGTWAPAGSATQCVDTGATCTIPYYVGIAAHADPASLTGLVSSIFPNGTSITSPMMPVKVGAAAGGAATSPTVGSITGGCSFASGGRVTGGPIMSCWGDGKAFPSTGGNYTMQCTAATDAAMVYGYTPPVPATGGVYGGTATLGTDFNTPIVALCIKVQ
jgi:hypothetical protein